MRDAAAQRGAAGVGRQRVSMDHVKGQEKNRVTVRWEGGMHELSDTIELNRMIHGCRSGKRPDSHA